VPGGGRIAWWESSLNLNPPPGQPITWTQHIIADVRGGTSVYATDVDDDNDVDVLGTAEYDDLIAWWQNDPSGNPPPADPVAWTQHTLDDAFDGAYCVYATDLDGDDDTDVLGAALGATTVAWWEHGDSLLTTEEITWTKHIIEDTFSGFPAWVYATDLDGDEDVDVLAADHGTEAGNAPIIWWENAGSPADGGWTKHTIETDYWAWRGVYATDVDSDGDVDILGAACESNVVVWWENDGTPRDGGWVVHVLDSAFSYPLSVYATDLDGDQDTDVLSAALAANTVAWWENVTHVTYQPLTLKNYGP
ncbi:MAG: VCBS repeat-containing protein, partial [Anaerolineae bacterium]